MAPCIRSVDRQASSASTSRGSTRGPQAAARGAPEAVVRGGGCGARGVVSDGAAQAGRALNIATAQAFDGEGCLKRDPEASASSRPTPSTLKTQGLGDFHLTLFVQTYLHWSALTAGRTGAGPGGKTRR